MFTNIEISAEIPMSTLVALNKVLTYITEDVWLIKNVENDFKSHILAQKIVYLLKFRYGLNVSWRFGWYITGPFSPMLACVLRVASQEFDEVQRCSAEATLKPFAIEMLDRAKSLFDVDYSALHLDKAEWAELLASIDYISRYKKLPLEDGALASAVAQNVKNKFSTDLVQLGIRYLRKFS